jgi:hypothetical protein
MNKPEIPTAPALNLTPMPWSGCPLGRVPPDPLFAQTTKRLHHARHPDEASGCPLGPVQGDRPTTDADDAVELI